MKYTSSSFSVVPFGNLYSQIVLIIVCLSCGPSAYEQEKRRIEREVQKADSIATLDSIKQSQESCNRWIDYTDSIFWAHSVFLPSDFKSDSTDRYSLNRCEQAHQILIYESGLGTTDENMNPLYQYSIINNTYSPITTMELHYLPFTVNHKKVKYLEKHYVNRIHHIYVPSSLRNTNSPYNTPRTTVGQEIGIPVIKNHYLWAEVTFRLNNGALVNAYIMNYYPLSLEYYETLSKHR